MVFCSQCKAQLPEGANYCGHCGTLAPHSDPSPNPPRGFPGSAQQVDQAAQEKPLGLLPFIEIGAARLGRDMLRGDLLITDQRLLILLYPAEQQGKDVMGNPLARLDPERQKRFLSLSPAAVMPENPLNFAVPASQVQKVFIEYHPATSEQPAASDLHVDAGAERLLCFIGQMNIQALYHLLKDKLGLSVRANVRFE